MRVESNLKGRPTKYPFPLFRVSDSYTLACEREEHHAVRAAASAWNRRYGTKFEVNVAPAGLVLRRVA